MKILARVTTKYTQQNKYLLKLVQGSWAVIGSIPRETFQEIYMGDYVELEVFCDYETFDIGLILQRVQNEKDWELHIEDFLNMGMETTELFHKSLKVLSNIENNDLKILAYSILTDSKLILQFLSVPGSLVHHNNFLHGLLWHSGQMMISASEQFQKYHRNLPDKDILVLGCLLHDLGKSYKYECTDIKEWKYSDFYRGVKHEEIGMDVFLEKLAVIDNFPEILFKKLFEIIMNHRGKASYKNNCRELFIVRHLDRLDATMQQSA